MDSSDGDGDYKMDIQWLPARPAIVYLAMHQQHLARLLLPELPFARANAGLRC